MLQYCSPTSNYVGLLKKKMIGEAEKPLRGCSPNRHNNNNKKKKVQIFSKMRNFAYAETCSALPKSWPNVRMFFVSFLNPFLVKQITFHQCHYTVCSVHWRWHKILKDKIILPGVNLHFFGSSSMPSFNKTLTMAS